MINSSSTIHYFIKSYNNEEEDRYSVQNKQSKQDYFQLFSDKSIEESLKNYTSNVQTGGYESFSSFLDNYNLDQTTSLDREESDEIQKPNYLGGHDSYNYKSYTDNLSIQPLAQSQKIGTMFEDESYQNGDLINQVDQIQQNPQNFQDKQKLPIIQKSIAKWQTKIQTQPKLNPKKTLKKQDTNNIGLIMFRSIVNHIESRHSDLYKELFIQNQILQKNIEMQDKISLGSKESFKIIFKEPKLQQICIKYLHGSFIRDLAAKTRLKNKRVVFKYIDSYIRGAINPDAFQCIKIKKQ